MSIKVPRNPTTEHVSVAKEGVKVVNVYNQSAAVEAV